MNTNTNAINTNSVNTNYPNTSNVTGAKLDDFHDKFLNHIFNIALNDDLKLMSKLKSCCKRYNDLITYNSYIYNLLYLNIKLSTNFLRFIKKNSARLKYLCTENLDSFANVENFKNVHSLVVTKDTHKTTFKYLYKFPNLRFLAVNFDVDDKDRYMPNFDEKHNPHLKCVKICGNFTSATKSGMESMHPEIQIYCCKKRMITPRKSPARNNTERSSDRNEKSDRSERSDRESDTESKIFFRELSLYTKICNKMEKKLSNLKKNTNSYREYTKTMNRHFENRKLGMTNFYTYGVYENNYENNDSD